MSSPHPESEEARAPRGIVLALVGITLLGVVLRAHGLGSDLWIDELATMSSSRGLSARELLVSYTSPNQHVLNSILLNWCIAIFGEHEWSVRLPAMVFGALSVPAMYWLARCCRFSRLLSLGSAMLLAVSYHHIGFSQNARGYTGYVLFSMVATACLVRLLERPRTGLAFAYVGAMGLNFIALLPSAFLFASHLIVAAVFFLNARRRNEHVPGRIRAIGITMGVTAALAALTYLPILTAITGVLNTAYKAQATAFPPLSLAFLREAINGVAAGFGGLLLAAVPLAILGAVGVWRLFRQAWVVVTVIIISQLMFFGMTVLLGWQIYPRFFILALPLGFLAVVATLELLGRAAERWGPPRLATAGPSISVALLCLVVAALIAALPRYYRTPKQSNRAATAEIGRRIGTSGMAVAVGTADLGFNYYAPRLGLPGDRTRSARTLAALDSITANYPAKDIYILTTFQHAFEAENPDLAAAVKAGWVRTQVFPAAVRGAEIILWEPKP
jgi:mannosyltransferase